MARKLSDLQISAFWGFQTPPLSPTPTSPETPPAFRSLDAAGTDIDFSNLNLGSIPYPSDLAIGEYQPGGIDMSGVARFKTSMDPVNMSPGASNYDDMISQPYQAPGQDFYASSRTFYAPDQIFQASGQTFHASGQAFQPPGQTFHVPGQAFYVPGPYINTNASWTAQSQNNVGTNVNNSPDSNLVPTSSDPQPRAADEMATAHGFRDLAMFSAGSFCERDGDDFRCTLKWCKENCHESSTREKVLQHIKKEIKKRRFACTCERRYKNKAECTRHITEKNNPDAYRCQVKDCGYATGRPDCLLSHERTDHENRTTRSKKPKKSSSKPYSR